MPFSSIMGRFLFDQWTRNQVNKQYINFVVVICALVLTSHSNYQNKTMMLFLIFDFDSSGDISIDELIVIVIGLVQAFCGLTNQVTPSTQKIEQFAKIMFLQGDNSWGRDLKLNAILQWLSINFEYQQILLIFEPSYKIDEDFQTFNTFQPLQNISANKIFEQIRLSHTLNIQQMNEVTKKLRNNFSSSSIQKKIQKENDKTIFQQKKQFLRLGSNKILSKKMTTIIEKNDVDKIDEAMQRRSIAQNIVFIDTQKEKYQKQQQESLLTKDQVKINFDKKLITLKAKITFKAALSAKKLDTDRILKTLSSNNKLNKSILKNSNKNAQSHQVKLNNQNFFTQIPTQMTDSFNVDLNQLTESEEPKIKTFRQRTITDSEQDMYMPQITKSSHSSRQQLMRSTSRAQRSQKQPEVIIMQGKSLSKTDVFKIKKYYDELSGQKTQINQVQFLNKFSKDKQFIKDQCFSLFQHLDVKKNGFIQFQDYLDSLWPQLKSDKPKQQIIKSWLKKHDEFIQKQQPSTNVGKQTSGKKVFPLYCYERLVYLFQFIDDSHNGQICYEDFEKHLKQKDNFQEGELEKAFKQADWDRTGRLDIEQFAQFIIPSDFIIEDIQELYRLYNRSYE